MKKFTSMIVMVLFTMSMFAFSPAGKAVKSLDFSGSQRILKAVNAQAPRQLNSGKRRVQQRAAEDFPIISEQPQGELRSYARSGKCYVTQNQQLYYSTQSGTIEIVFGNDNKVYFKDIINGTSYGTWVEGTLSQDGSTITVPLGQNIYYESEYNACIVLNRLAWDNETGFAPTEATEITYSVSAEGVISLQNSDEDHTVGGIWSDDNSIGLYGDYESVYTPYTPNTDVVTPPDGMASITAPMSGTYYASIGADGEAISSTVTIGLVGSEIYIQGLVAQMPEVWVKGTIGTDGTVSIPVTYLGEYNGNPAYLMGYSSSNPVSPVSFVLNQENMTAELDGYAMVSYSETENTILNSRTGFYYSGLFIGTRPEALTPPDGLLPYEMPYTGLSYDGEAQSDISGTVNLAFSMTDGLVYVQGLIPELPEAWMVGSINADGTEITFASGQYLGYDDFGSLYAVGGDVDGNIQDIVFSFDKLSNVATLQNYIYVNGKPDQIYYFTILSDIVIGIVSDDMWIASQQGYNNTQEVASINIAEGVTGTLAQNDGTNSPKYYNSDESLRMYACNSLVITSQKAIAKIIFNLIGNENQMLLEANVGEYALDGNVGTWTGEANEITFSVPCTSGKQARIVSIQIFYLDYGTMTVELPEGVTTTSYMFTGTDSYDNSEVSREVLVAFDGNDVYFQGLTTIVPEAWVKGTMAADGTITIPGWYVGQYDTYLFGVYDLYYGEQSFSYDSEADKFTSANYSIMASQNGGEKSVMEEYNDVIILHPQDIAATPQDPTINAVNLSASYPSIQYTIPTKDADGNVLDISKLYYVVYYVKDGVQNTLTLSPELYEKLTAELTEIPYTFSDEYDIYSTRLYLNQGAEELATWTKIGLQVIYRGGNEEHTSNIVWYELGENTALEDVKADVIETIYYDMLGRRVDNSLNGVYIQRQRLSNGSVITNKVLIRNK